MPIAESFTALLEDWVDRLESGMHPVRDGEIQRFAEKNIPEAITNGVKIRASPLFIYEESLPGATYSWAYRIFMSMDESCQPADAYACQLTTRAWNIVDATGHVEQVRGPGVIGLYPKMFPGAEFSYESRCPLRVPSGTMEGWFEMRLKDGSVFNAIVPKFQFEVPKFIVEKNTSPKAE
jgi:ApaG protein